MANMVEFSVLNPLDVDLSASKGSNLAVGGGGGVGPTPMVLKGLRHYSGNVLIHNVLFHLATVQNSPK